MAPPRRRRFDDDEEARLLSACAALGLDELGLLIRLLATTAMRLSEALAVETTDFRGRFLYLDETKTNEPRTVVLTREALDVVERLRARIGQGSLFAFDVATVENQFARARAAAGLEDFRLHDLRHEGTSRYFELGMQAMEVMDQTGHRTLRMLRQYRHFRNPRRLAEIEAAEKKRGDATVTVRTG